MNKFVLFIMLLAVMILPVGALAAPESSWGYRLNPGYNRIFWFTNCEGWFSGFSESQDANGVWTADVVIYQYHEVYPHWTLSAEFPLTLGSVLDETLLVPRMFYTEDNIGRYIYVSSDMGNKQIGTPFCDRPPDDNKWQRELTLPANSMQYWIMNNHRCAEYTVRWQSVKRGLAIVDIFKGKRLVQRDRLEMGYVTAETAKYPALIYTPGIVTVMSDMGNKLLYSCK